MTNLVFRWAVVNHSQHLVPMEMRESDELEEIV